MHREHASRVAAGTLKAVGDVDTAGTFEEDFNAVLDGHGNSADPAAALVSPHSGNPIVKAANQRTGGAEDSSDTDEFSDN